MNIRARLNKLEGAIRPETAEALPPAVQELIDSIMAMPHAPVPGWEGLPFEEIKQQFFARYCQGSEGIGSYEHSKQGH